MPLMLKTKLSPIESFILYLLEISSTKITIKNENIESKCGWSPFKDVEFKGTPVATIISGKIKMKDGKILGEPEGTPLKFS